MFTEENITSKSYAIEIEPQELLAICKLDGECSVFEDTLCGQLYKILGHDNADYDLGFVGNYIYVTIDMLHFDKKAELAEQIILEYIDRARCSSDFYADGEDKE